MATRSTFKCVNYLHRSDIYVRLTRTNLQSNSHYQKKKKKLIQVLLWQLWTVYIFLFYLSQKTKKGIVSSYNKKTGQIHDIEINMILRKINMINRGILQSTIMIHCQLSLLNHIKNNRETENRSAHHKHRHQS